MTPAALADNSKAISEQTLRSDILDCSENTKECLIPIPAMVDAHEVFILPNTEMVEHGHTFGTHSSGKMHFSEILGKRLGTSETLYGQVIVMEDIYSDGTIEEVFLFHETGTGENIPQYYLDLEGYDGMSLHSGQSVIITGDVYELQTNMEKTVGNHSQNHFKLLRPQSITSDHGASESERSKSSSLLPEGRTVTTDINSVTILINFNDTRLEPHSPEYFETIFYDHDSESLASYFDAHSNGKAIINGTVYGWVTLSNSSDYIYGSYFDKFKAGFDALDVLGDLIDLDGPDNIIQNDSSENVFRSGNNGDDVDQIIFVLSGMPRSTPASAFYSPLPVVLDDGRVMYASISANPDTGDGFSVGQNHGGGFSTPAHELGHNFNWRHTPPHYPYSVYNDFYSIMSNTSHGPGPVGIQKFLAGWISTDNIVVAQNGVDVTFTLDPIFSSFEDDDKVLGIIPFGNDGEFYSVEYRIDVTFDSLPYHCREGCVAIYHYDPSYHTHVHERYKTISIVPINELSPYDSALREGNTWHDYLNAISISYTLNEKGDVVVGVDYGIDVPSTAGWNSFGTRGNGDEQFQRIKGLAIDSENKIFAADENTIKSFSADADFLYSFGDADYRSIAINSFGDIISYNVNEDRMDVFSNNGDFKHSFGEEYSDSLAWWVDIAIDSRDRVYVASGYDGILVFSNNGQLLNTISYEEDGKSERLMTVAVDSEDNVYSMNTYQKYIRVFSQNGTYIDTLDAGNSLVGSPVSASVLDISPNDELYVGDQRGMVHVFSSDGQKLDSFGGYGESLGQFGIVDDIAFTRTGDALVFNDYTHFRIQTLGTFEDLPDFDAYLPAFTKINNGDIVILFVDINNAFGNVDLELFSSSDDLVHTTHTNPDETNFTIPWVLNSLPDGEYTIIAKNNFHDAEIRFGIDDDILTDLSMIQTHMPPKISSSLNSSSIGPGDHVSFQGHVENFDPITYDGFDLSYRVISSDGDLMQVGQLSLEHSGSFEHAFLPGISWQGDTGYSVELFFHSAFDELALDYSGIQSTGLQSYCGKPEISYDSIVRGTDQDDDLFGTSGMDLILGFGGNDVIRSGDGNDCVYGGDGADRIYGGNGDDTLNGNSGNDIMEGNRGNDIMYGGAGDDQMEGNRGADTIHGNDGSDRINGKLGNDKIYGGDGNDILKGEDGNDKLYGNAGNDDLFCGSGKDNAHGGKGSDYASSSCENTGGIEQN